MTRPRSIMPPAFEKIKNNGWGLSRGKRAGEVLCGGVVGFCGIGLTNQMAKAPRRINAGSEMQKLALRIIDNGLNGAEPVDHRNGADRRETFEAREFAIAERSSFAS